MKRCIVLLLATIVSTTNAFVVPTLKRTSGLLESRVQFDKKETNTISNNNVDDDDELYFASETFDPVLNSASTETTFGGKELTLWTARGILLLVAAIWGTNFAAVKYIEELCFHPPCNHPPSEAAFFRFGIAAMVSIPLLINQRKDVIMAGLECGLWISMGYICQAMALSSISSGKCAFICSLTVVFVPIVSALLYGKPLKAANFVAAAIAVSGVAVLEGMINIPALLGIQPAVAADTTSILTSSVLESGPLSNIANSIGVGKGDLIALGQPIGFGYAFTRIEHHQERFKDVPNRVLTIAAAQCVMVGLVATLWVLHDYNWSFPNFGYMWEWHRVTTILWTGIVTTVFAIFLEGIALQKASATDAAITFSSEPVWASMFGFLLLNEQLTTNAYIGGAIIMGACIVGAVSDLPKDDVVDVKSKAIDSSESQP